MLTASIIISKGKASFSAALFSVSSLSDMYWAHVVREVALTGASNLDSTESDANPPTEDNAWLLIKSLFPHRL